MTKEEYLSQLEQSDLFDLLSVGQKSISVLLKNTKFHYTVVFVCAGKFAWRWSEEQISMPHTNKTFEEVFISVPPEIQTKLIFYMDLFR